MQTLTAAQKDKILLCNLTFIVPQILWQPRRTTCSFSFCKETKKTWLLELSSNGSRIYWISSSKSENNIVVNLVLIRSPLNWLFRKSLSRDNVWLLIDWDASIWGGKKYRAATRKVFLGECPLPSEWMMTNHPTTWLHVHTGHTLRVSWIKSAR